jgi:hypothetical protein
MAARDVRCLVWLLAASACAVQPYSPCPVDVPAALPAGAFAACRQVLADSYGTVVVADEQAFLLQTAWAPTDPAGERRAAVFRDPTSSSPDALAVVVEVRRISEPLLGLPQWTAPRGDPAAERELAESLAAALTR